MKTFDELVSEIVERHVNQYKRGESKRKVLSDLGFMFSLAKKQVEREIEKIEGGK